MAIWHADNFSFYGTNAVTSKPQMLDGIWAALTDTVPSTNFYIGIEPDPDGISPGRVLKISAFASGNTARARIANPTGATTGQGIAGRFWFSKLPGDNVYVMRLMEFLNDASSAYFYLSVGSTGTLAVRTSAGATLEVTAAPAITANGWYHIEMFADQTNFEVRVEGTTVLGPTPHGISTPAYAQASLAYQDTFPSTVTPATIGLNMYVKDFVCYDDQGTANNTFLGSVICGNKTVTSDVSLNWTPSTGSTGYQILDNIPPDDNIFLYADDTLPPAYVGGLSSLPPETTSVRALVTFVRAAKSDGGDGSLQTGLISDPDGTPATALGQDRSITVGQTYWRDVFEVDPKTGLAWTPSAADLVQLQLNRTS